MVVRACPVSRELEVNLEGDYARDRESVEFHTLDVLSALASVEQSARLRGRG